MDSHVVHFHLTDVQVVNRVDWANVTKMPYFEELGWKESVRTNPMEDVCVALKPTSMVLPFSIPNSNRLLDPTTPANSTINFLPIIPPIGVPAVAQLANVMTNFGWEYVWHCHMLGHEENDFMRPLCLIVLPPAAPSTLTAVSAPSPTAITINLTWRDNSTNEQSFTIQRATNTGFTAGLTTFTVVANATAFSDTSCAANVRYYYRVAATNGAGNSAWSNAANTTSARGLSPQAPTNLAAGATTATSVVLNWTVNGTCTGVQIQRATNATFTAGLVTTTVNTANLSTRTVTGLRTKRTYYFRVAERNGAINSPWSNVLTVTTP